MQSLFAKFSLVTVVFGAALVSSDVIARDYERHHEPRGEHRNEHRGRHDQRHETRHYEPRHHGYHHDHHHDNRTYGHGYYRDSHYHYPRSAPPAHREAYPAPRVGHVWIPGYWDWRLNNWEWVVGYWVLERQGYHYEPHRWVHRGSHYFPEPGRWSRWSRTRDSDRDGVPNRYDRDPYNYYRR
jgi:hypothetical protein